MLSTEYAAVNTHNEEEIDKRKNIATHALADPEYCLLLNILSIFSK